MLSSKFRVLAEPLGIRDQFSSPDFYVPCCIYFGSLALRRSQIEREETDSKAVNPSSSVTLQRVWMLGESWVSGLNNLGDYVWISLTLYWAAGTWALPVCVPPPSLSPCGSEPALRGQSRPSKLGQPPTQVTTALTQLSLYERSAGNVYLPVSTLLKVFMSVLTHCRSGPRPSCPSIL